MSARNMLVVFARGCCISMIDHSNFPGCSTFTGAESFPGPLLTRGAGILVDNNKVVFG